MNSATVTNGDTHSAVSEISGIERHRAQQAFIERGLASLAAAKKSGEYVSSEEVMRELDEMLAKALKKAPK